MKTNSPLRPVIIIAPGVLAGAEKVVLTGLSALSDLGQNPLLIVIKETRVPHFAEEFIRMTPKSIETISVTATRAFDLSLPQKIKMALQKETGPLVIHTHGFKALIAVFLMRANAPHVHTHHGNTAHTFKVRLYEKLALLVMKSCQAIIAVSEEMKIQLTKSLDEKKIRVVDNMLSFKNAQRIREARLKNQKHQKIQLIFIGRLSPEKGLVEFLNSWGTHPLKDHFFLNILGDGSEKEKILETIERHQLQHLVKLHGFVQDPSIYMIEADLLIMPSLREGLPMTLIESLAVGVPVLANNVGAIKSLVTHEENGYLTTDSSDEAWKKALSIAQTMYPKWQESAADKALSVEEKFSAKKWAKKTSEIYESVK